VETKKKRVSETEMKLIHLAGPSDANNLGFVHGGIVMKLLDELAYACASAFAEHHAVTVVVNKVEFLQPVKVGHLIDLDAKVVFAGRTSVEVRVEVRTRDVLTGVSVLSNTAYLTMVALDDAGKPTGVPELVVETDDDKREWEAAKSRHEEFAKARAARKT